MKRQVTVPVTPDQQKYVGDGTTKKKYKVLITRKATAFFSTMVLIIKKDTGGNFIADVSFSSNSGTTINDITTITEDELADLIGKYSCRRFRINGEGTLAMDVAIGNEQKGYEYGDFTADVSFSSNSGTTVKDITSIKENELTDVVKRYRTFIECIKKEEQKELSSTKKNLMHRIFSRSNVHHIAKTINRTSMKKTMIANGVYLKNAAMSTAKVKMVIAEMNNLKDNSVNRDIYTRINVGGIIVVTRSTIELDADIVNIIQKEPEVENLTLRNFILNIHASNISLSTFFSLNKINQIFFNFGMVIGFSRMATTPFSLYYGYGAVFAAISLNPIPLLYEALPTGLFIFIPRIARLIIRRKLRKAITFRK